MKKLVFITLLLIVFMSWSVALCAPPWRPAAVGDLFNMGYSGYDVRVYGAYGDGSTDDSGSFTTAAVAAANNLIIVPSTGSNYVIDANTTIPATVGLWIKDGAVLEVSSGVTLTISGTLYAGMSQIFDTSPGGTVSLSAGSCEQVIPQWWGALGDGLTSCHDAFEAAITAAQTTGKIYIPSGTYVIEDTIDACWPTGVSPLGVGGLVVEGAGQSDTILSFSPASGWCFHVTAPNDTDQYAPTTVVIRDLHFQAPNVTDPSLGGGIMLNASYSTVKDCNFTNMPNGTAIAVANKLITTTESSMTNDEDIDFTTTGAGAAEKIAVKVTTPTRAQTVHSVTARLGITGSPAGTVHAEIWSDSSGPSAQIGQASATVTINTISSDADGEDVTFTFDAAGAVDEPSVSASTAYWIVLETVGYTYTDTTTELRLRSDDDGGTSEVATFTFGGAWSVDADDGSNNSIVVGYGQPLSNRIQTVNIPGNSSPAVARGIWGDDNSVIFLSDSTVRATTCILFDGHTLLTSNNYIFGTAALDVKATAYSSTGDYHEGTLTYGNKWTSANAGTQPVFSTHGGLTHGEITWDTHLNPRFYGTSGFRYGTDDPSMFPEDWKYRVFTAGNQVVWLNASGNSLATDANALDGNCQQVSTISNAVALEFRQSSADGYLYGKLPRGTYLVTAWIKDSNQLANDVLLRSLYYDGAWQTQLSQGYTVTANYEPYSWLHRVPADAMGSGDYRSRIAVQKATSGANTISVSHYVIQYIGPDTLGDRHLIAWSTDVGDADGDRNSSVKFVGMQSGKEQSLLAEITASHDGAADDEKGDLIFKTNDGSDKLVPTEAMRIDSAQELYLKSGTGISEFSTDGTMAGNSDDAVPTEQAVKTYADALSYTLDEIGNLAANKTFNNAAYSVSFNFTNPTNGPTYDGAFEIQASGAFTGDLFHVHQHTGNPGSTDLVHFEATDADVMPLRVTGVGTINSIFSGGYAQFSNAIVLSGGANPTTNVAGMFDFDTDEVALEVYDGSASRIIGTVKIAQIVIIDPDAVQAIEDAVVILKVHADWAPGGIKLISCGIDTDQSSTYSVDFEEWTSPTDGSPSAIETVATSTSTEAEDDGTLTDSDIAVGSIIMADLPVTDIDMLTVWITYWVKDFD